MFILIAQCNFFGLKLYERINIKIMKKRRLFLSVCLAAVGLSNMAYAEEISSLPIYFNDSLIEFKNPPIMEAGCTIVPIRELSEKAGFTVLWDEVEKSVDAYNNKTRVLMYIDNNNIKVLNSDGVTEDITSILPPKLVNSVTYIPLRTVSEAFGAEVEWNSQNNAIYIYMKDLLQDAAVKQETAHAFYSQYDPTYVELYSAAPYNWTAGRNGYCYVTSYAMLLTNLTGTAVTPKDVADINYQAGGNPTMCYHGSIVGKYGKRLVSALDTGSIYYKSYDSSRGLTYIDNSSSENVIAALKEALDRNPEGVMVRDTSMPHTMVAVGYEGDTVYFNDPALSEGRVSWDKTCLKKRDITTIEAIIAID